MKRLGLFLLALLATCSLIPIAYAQTSPFNQGTLANLSDSVGVYCPSLSTFLVHVGTGVTGTVTVYTAANTGTSVVASPGPTTSPFFVTTAGGSTYTQTMTSFPGDLYGTLGSASYVYAVLTTASGGSSTATVRCSSAVGPVNGGGGTVSISSLPPVTVSSLPPPVQPSPIYTVQVNTPGPYASAVIFDNSGNALTPLAQSTSSAQPVQTTLPANAYLYGMNAAKTGWFPIGNAGGASGGALVTQMCPASGLNVNCVIPTASPNGDAAANSHPLVVVAPCANNAGTMNCAAVNATQQLSVTTPAPVTAVSAAICTPTGAPCVSPTASPNGGSALNLLPTAGCGNATGTTQCAAVAPAGDGTVGSVTYNYRLLTASILYGLNSGTGFEDPVRNAPSPAPTGVPALGYNNLGAAAPAICIQGASQQTASTTAVVLVAAVGAANRIYPCEIDYTITAITAAVATATATIEYGTQTTNPCDTGTVVLKKFSFGSGSITTGVITTGQAIGNGLGIVGPIGALNNQVCIVVSSVDEQFDVNLTYAAAP